MSSEMMLSALNSAVFTILSFCIDHPDMQILGGIADLGNNGLRDVRGLNGLRYDVVGGSELAQIPSEQAHDVHRGNVGIDCLHDLQSLIETLRWSHSIRTSRRAESISRS